MADYQELFIGGEWVAPAGQGRIEVISPITEEVYGTVPDAAEADVDRAVAAARRAFDEGPWPRMAPEARADAIARLSAELQARSMDIADTITNENGSVKSFSLMGQVFASTMVLDKYAEIARTYEFENRRMGALGGDVRVRRAPVGVVAGIIPWNVPLYITAMKLGPAMASGSTIVLKPSPETPLDAYQFAEAVIAAGIPEGVINIVAADRAVSEYLVSHPQVDKVSFTGSTAVGRRIGSICGEQIKRCTLELGGKSAAIILDDVQLDDALLSELLMSGLMNNGQVCGAQSRILVPRSRYDEIVDRIGEGMANMVVGDPNEDASQIGPMVAQRQQERVNGYIEIGKQEGARVVTGGGPAQFDKGWFVTPTLFADANNQMRIAREEIFGPVLTAIPYDTEAEAIAIANDSDYGLCGSVWTSDVEHAAEVGAQVRTGVVAVNSSMILDFNSPFGGFKQSGIGRELGPEGLDHFTELQSIILPAAG
ncbi:MAG: aldehyde dehydrogenase [Actinomycetes bacterium]